jgi:hypothetical protein
MVNYELAGLQETFLGYGTITMQTFFGDLVIHDLHHPGKIQKKLLEILRDSGVPASGFPGKDAAANEQLDSEPNEA